MANIKTNNKHSNDNIERLLKTFESWVNQQKKSATQSKKDKELEALQKRIDAEAKEHQTLIENYRKKVKALEDEKKEDKYKENLNLAKNSVNAVMPADRRQHFGAAGVGALLGIDPAIVQMLGIDKLGANLWNSKMGFGAIQKRHDQKVKEEKLNEEFGINSGKDKEKYGSVVKDDPNKELKEINKGIQQVARNTGTEKGGVEKESKEKGGLLEKILGFGKKLLIPMLIGMLVNAFRGHIKNAVSDLLGGGEFGDFLGGAVADFLPGALGGLAAARKFGVPWWQGMLVGGTITYVWPRLVQTITDIKDAVLGEGNPDAGNTNRYLEKALAGALLGASIMKWRAGSFKAAGIGAAIGLTTEFLLARANDLKALLSGKATEIKTIAGIPEPIIGGIISGGTIGAFSGKSGFNLKGFAIGALVGGTIGLISAMITDSNNIYQGTKNGGNPESAFGSWGKVISTTIAGAAIGAKYGIRGALIGALIGGAIGTIWKLIDDVTGSVNKDRDNGRKGIEKNLTVGDSKDAKDSTNYAYNRKRELEEKKAAGTLTKEEKKELGKIEDATYLAEKRSNHFDEADTNGDGVIDPSEMAAFDKKVGTSLGGHGESRTKMMEAMQAKGGKAITREDLTNYVLEEEGIKAPTPLETTQMPTTSQIQDDANTKATEANTKSQAQLSSSVDNLTETLKASVANQGTQSQSSVMDTAYPSGGITAAGQI